MMPDRDAGTCACPDGRVLADVVHAALQISESPLGDVVSPCGDMCVGADTYALAVTSIPASMRASTL
jgi:hypothetical protein